MYVYFMIYKKMMISLVRYASMMHIRKESILLLVDFLIARDIEYIFSIERYKFYILYEPTFLIFCFLSKIILVKL